MKRFISLALCLIMVLSISVVSLSVSAAAPENAADYIEDNMLYAHAVNDAEETEAWQYWQNADVYRDYDEEDLEDLGLVAGEGVSKEKYFFLPSSVAEDKVTIMNTYDVEVKIGDTVIPAGGYAEVAYNTEDTFTVEIGDETHLLRFMHSTAEAAIYINNPDADGNGTDLLTYLSEDKENEAKATGAIVDDEGNVDNTPVKKIKGRGNTTWLKNKKPFNVTYDSAVSVDGMVKTKKLSLLANYQDSALVRNRFLQDLSDAIGMPYASDSRFVDLYMNGEYIGSYQLTQKVDIGKNNLVPEIDDDTHLNEDGTLKDEFPFICEVDSAAGEGDYYIKTSSAGCKLTLKGPEIDEGDPYHDEVLQIAKTKFDNMYNAIRLNSANMAELVDIDSLAKIMLINELSKNWDVGVSSLYFVYKQDTDGSWKFFASPVWDYDNSLGNATGVIRDLDRMGVDDYEEPTGWWVQFKPGASNNKSGRYTILGWAARNDTVMNYAAQVWFDEFLPAIQTFNSNGVAEGELYSSDVYYKYLTGTADMNYTLGWLLTTGEWICDHSELTNGKFDYATGEFIEDSAPTYYDPETFEGQYNYTVDWLNTRVAWLSAQFYADYEGEITPPPTVYYLGDADLDGKVNVKDATAIQKHVAELSTLSENGAICAEADGSGDINVKDATAIQKYAAALETGYPIGEEITI